MIIAFSKRTFIALIICYLAINVIICQESLKDLKSNIHSTCQNPEHKHYDKKTLAYITPWNNLGVELVLKYYAKFDIVSPCWFDLKPEILQGKFNMKIDGANLVNFDFIEQLREKKSDIKIVPRFICSDFQSPDQFTEWFKEENINQFIKILMRRLKNNQYDGMVFECMQIWLLEDIYAPFTKFLTKLYESLKKENMILVNVIFPYTETLQNILSKIRFEYISKYSDYLNVMTYDYFNYGKKGAEKSNYLAPMSWIEKTLNYYIDFNKSNKDDLLKKLLLGLPFHGILLDKTDNKGNIINAKAYSEIITNIHNADLQWNKKECEHVLEMEEQGKEIMANYPTKKFFEERLKYSITHNLAGVAIWDLAQGLDNFLDLF